jgi:uncharacterized membrane protein HdeD (DUF308 family)
MRDHLARNWWLLALRGTFAILFGVLALVWPGIAVASLVLLFGAYALADGLVDLVLVFARGESAGHRIWLGLQGVVSLAAGVLTFAYPGITALTLLLFIGVWALVTGVLQVYGGIRLRREIEDEWLLIAGGVLTILFGLFVLVRPGSGALAVVLLIGINAIVFGVDLIALSLRLRGLAAGSRPAAA